MLERTPNPIVDPPRVIPATSRGRDQISEPRDPDSDPTDEISGTDRTHDIPPPSADYHARNTSAPRILGTFLAVVIAWMWRGWGQPATGVEMDELLIAAMGPACVVFMDFLSRYLHRRSERRFEGRSEVRSERRSEGRSE